MKIKDALRALIASTLAALVAFAPAMVRAQDAPQGEVGDAQKNMERGSDAMARGDFKGATVFFRAAKELKPDATGPLLALGLALKANGECQEALAHLEEYYKRKPDGDTKGKDAIDFCKKEIERQKAAAEAGKVPLTPAVAPAVVPEEPPKPVYKRWYLWTGVGAAVVGAVVLGVLLGLPGAKAPMGSTGPAQTAAFR